MSSATIDTLQVKISATATDAASALQKLADALKGVRDALGKTGKDGQTYGAKINRNLTELEKAIDKLNPDKFKKLAELSDNVAVSLDKINMALKGISLDSVVKIQALSTNLREYAEALKEVKSIRGSIKFPDVSAEIKKAEEDVSIPIKDDSATSTGGSKRVRYTADKLKQMGVFSKALTKETKDAGEEIKKTTGLFGKLIKSIGRIALYRAIRSAMKTVVEAFSEGLKNAYQFSKQSESFQRLADTLDRIKSVTSQMINQIGAFWGEVKQFILPVVEWLVERVRAAFEWLTEFFAALNGSDIYLQAQYVDKAWEDASDSVKKYKQQLLGLDELNNLTTQKQGNSAEDISKSFKEMAVRDEWKGLHATIESLTLDIQKIVPDFDNFTSKDLENILTTGLLSIAGGLLAGPPGAIVGAIGGILLTLGINKLKSEGETEYSKKGIYKVLKPALTSLIGGALGFKYGGATGALIGASAGLALGLLVQKLGKIKDVTHLSDDEKWSLIKNALVGLTGGIIGFTLGGVSGAVVGASLAISLDLIFEELHVVDDIKDKITTKILDLEEEWGIDLNRDGLIGYRSATEAVSVGTKQIDNIDDYFAKVPYTKNTVPTVKVPTAKDLTLQSIDSALRNGKKTTTTSNSYGVLDAVRDVVSDIKTEGLGTVISNAFEDLFEWKAGGGIASQGSLFWSGEAGPEFIGSIGNTSAVANTGQMTEAIYKAAYMGMSKALKENGGSGMSGFEPATTDDLFIAMRKKASNYNKMTGNSAFA